MKYFLLIVLVPFSFLGLMAQSSTTLDDIYGSENANQIREQYPERIEFIEFYNENGYYLAEIPSSKNLEALKDISDIEKLHENLPDITSSMIENKVLNILGYNFRLSENEVQYYRVDENYMLVLIDAESIRKQFQEITD
ncbi:hypothetical protein O3Q51_11400 [Cryomorphaceae bacterium 1068]|nr:hypothetical protein [Cryomorphaceae bacterium 1068]